jgi:hypothetical protein
MPSLTLESTCGEAVEKLKASGASCLAVCDANGKAIGIMPATDLMTRLAKRKVTLSDNVAYICLKVFRSVSGHMPVSELARVLGRYPNAVVNSKNGKPRCVSSADLVQFMGQQMGGVKPKKRSRKPLRPLRSLLEMKIHLQKARKKKENKCKLLDSACSLPLPVAPPGCT